MKMLFLLLPLLLQSNVSEYTCTLEQLDLAREVFVPCIGEKHFIMCYEVAIEEYCTKRLFS